MPSNNPLPPHEANLFKKILKSYEQKQYKKSLQYVKEILKKFPEHGETLSMKGLILNSSNKKSEAYECAQKGLRNDVKSHVCWHVYGLIQRSDRKYDEAIKCYRNALRCDPENLQILRDLSLLQIQIRDLEGYRDTRYQLLQLRPTQRVSWIGYAMSYHLLKDYEIANSILEEFIKTQPKTIDFEQSELLLYQNMVYREAQLYEQSLKHLEENQTYILDKLKLEEMRGEAYLKLNQREKAAKVFEDLIERNPDHSVYYKRLEECLHLNTTEDKLDLYKMYSEKYPRSDVPRKLPLEFVDDEKLFETLVDKYMQRAIRKGVPPLFKMIKYLFKDNEWKLKCVQRVVLGYVANLTKHSRFSETDEQKEAPTSLLWSYYLLAQLYDHIKEYDTALEYINKALEHTPTLVELYIVKGKIFKHRGNFYEAVVCLDEAQSLDTADRFINYKCSKYMLRANLIKESQDIAAKFTRESTHPAEYLKEMQCMWFETESADAYRRLKKYGESLKKCHQVERHFQEFIEDQFDFHSYCMRKMTLCSYVDMLRLEDRIKDHRFFFRAAKTAIQVYLHLHDHPLADQDSELNANTENLSASELKKLKNKQKKAQIKAQQEKERVEQLEQKKKELNKQKNKDDADAEQNNEEELVPEKLEKPENALEECMRFLRPLEEFGQHDLQTLHLAFEVYYRKNKVMLMLRQLKKLLPLRNEKKASSVFHYCLCKFLLKYNSTKSTLNEVVQQVVDKEIAELGKSLQLSLSDSVEKLNETLFNQQPNNIDSYLNMVKITFDLNPSQNQKKALTLLADITNPKFNLNIKTALSVYDLVANSEYFGRLDETSLNEFRSKLRAHFSTSSAFRTSDEEENDVQSYVKNLTITVAANSSAEVVSDKMSSLNLKSN